MFADSSAADDRFSAESAGEYKATEIN